MTRTTEETMSRNPRYLVFAFVMAGLAIMWASDGRQGMAALHSTFVVAYVFMWRKFTRRVP